jgi:AbrB family looped-hinge helix DNA binding protein
MFICFTQCGGVEMRIVKIAKVTSNDSTELIYIPKEIRQALKLNKGVYVKLTVEGQRLIVEPLELQMTTKQVSEFDSRGDD